MMVAFLYLNTFLDCGRVSPGLVAFGGAGA